MAEAPTQVRSPQLDNGPVPPSEPPRRKRRGLIIGGVIAGVVALGAAGAAVVLLSGSSSKGTTSVQAVATYGQKLTATLTPVVTDNQALSRALQAVDGSKATLRVARDAASTLQQQVTSSRGALAVLQAPASETLLQQQATQALTQEAGYVQAVASTLGDPSSNSSGSLQSLASATSSAFVPLARYATGGSTSISGVDNLLSWVSGAQAAKKRAEKPKVIVQNNTTTTTTSVPSTPTSVSPSGGMRFVDQNIQANSNTSDGLAENVFKAYWGAAGSSSTGWGNADITAYSPASGTSYAFSCTTDGTTVYCSGLGNTGDPLYVQFPMWAVEVY